MDNQYVLESCGSVVKAGIGDTGISDFFLKPTLLQHLIPTLWPVPRAGVGTVARLQHGSFFLQAQPGWRILLNPDNLNLVGKDVLGHLSGDTSPFKNNPLARKILWQQQRSNKIQGAMSIRCSPHFNIYLRAVVM